MFFQKVTCFILFYYVYVFSISLQGLQPKNSTVYLKTTTLNHPNHYRCLRHWRSYYRHFCLLNFEWVCWGYPQLSCCFKYQPHHHHPSIRHHPAPREFFFPKFIKGILMPFVIRMVLQCGFGQCQHPVARRRSRLLGRRS